MIHMALWMDMLGGEALCGSMGDEDGRLRLDADEMNVDCEACRLKMLLSR